MQVKWKKLTARLLVWFASELVLSSFNLDTLADYSEFLVNQKGWVELVKANCYPGCIVGC